jgi:hypothetical protein
VAIRSRLSRRASKRDFARKSHVHRRNIDTRPMRGGIRL